ncbi:MAG: hypothetical protein KatS3mg105_5266 [Gemmatales bacterium]|nr:MAG: hypothetical protein KatS3mg105_5266 [Gemmatales bacterium]
MLQITPHMRLLVAVEPAGFRKSIDGLVRLCKDVLDEDPMEGAVFVFRNRRGTAIKVLMYDDQGQSTRNGSSPCSRCCHAAQSDPWPDNLRHTVCRRGPVEAPGTKQVLISIPRRPRGHALLFAGMLRRFP